MSFSFFDKYDGENQKNFIKTIVIFAKSYKHGNYCVAGKDIFTREWVRPVADINGKELPEKNIRVTNSNWANKPPYALKPLQKIKIKFLQEAPLVYQPENCVIDSSYLWQQNYKIEFPEIEDYLDSPISLWGQGRSLEARLIRNNEISITNSLYLIRVSNLNLYYKVRSLRATFIYNQITYDFPVTDPMVLENKTQGLFANAILCVSLGEEFEKDGCHYKLVAGVFLE